MMNVKPEFLLINVRPPLLLKLKKGRVHMNTHMMVWDKDRSGMDLSPSIPSLLSSPPSSLPIILMPDRLVQPSRNPLIY